MKLKDTEKSHRQNLAKLKLRTFASMAISKLRLLFLLSVILFLHRPVLSDDEDLLLTIINKYRTSQNLATLTPNDNADCLAEEIADQFKNRPCTNTTVSASVPGSEPQLQNYPNLLKKCHLNVTAMKDSVILPACVSNHDQSLVSTNFTKSEYLKNLNDSKFTGIGIGSDDIWLVVVLTTKTSEDSFSPAVIYHHAGGFTLSINGFVNHFLVLFLLFCFMF